MVIESFMCGDSWYQNTGALCMKLDFIWDEVKCWKWGSLACLVPWVCITLLGVNRLWMWRGRMCLECMYISLPNCWSYRCFRGNIFNCLCSERAYSFYFELVIERIASFCITSFFVNDFEADPRAISRIRSKDDLTSDKEFSDDCFPRHV
jgi:hypothetical protein